MAKKMTFYWYDWKERPDFSQIQRSIEAVFSGSAPYIAEVSDPQWDQVTVAICSEQIDPATIDQVFLANIHGKEIGRWDGGGPIPIFVAP